jgi:hypothetical protein
MTEGAAELERRRARKMLMIGGKMERKMIPAMMK